ncbi:MULTISPECIES: hypothetical protein [Chryseobacterium]|nr:MULTISPECIES: hypothetical protein [Chryseobacterium]
MKTISHSEAVEAFRQFCQGWDDRVHTQDDRETQLMVRNKLMKAIGRIEYFLGKSDEKAMLKARGNLIPGSNEANEKEVLAMFENQKKDWYKDFKEISHDINYIMCIMENVYELKNRRSYESFQLRAENHKLRAEIERLRNEKQ